MISKNVDDVMQYPKGDVRRWFVLLTAIDILVSPTLVNLAAFTGHNKGTIPADVEKIREQLKVDIRKIGAKYIIEDWGPILKKNGVKGCLNG